MSPIISIVGSESLPAPIWRRFAASIYDGLLLLGLWMMAALLDVLVRDALGLPRNPGAFQGLVFLLGFGFFGWFWTHGGQTLGMRVWRLQVRRRDGNALRWPLALLRYAVLMLTWLAVLLPALLQMPKLAALVHAGPLSVAGIVFSAFALLSTAVDRQRRAPCDFAAFTEVVMLAKPEPSAAA